MANFRCERVFVNLDEPVPGVNHLRAVNPEDFSAVFYEELDNAISDSGARALSEFLFAPFDRPKWRPASDGLRSIRKAIEICEAWLEAANRPLARIPEAISRDVAVLKQVEGVLDAADFRDRRFYFLAKDLP